ncbi:MAG: GGDEF domain-containing protein [Thiolinea sp.]
MIVILQFLLTAMIIGLVTSAAYMFAISRFPHVNKGHRTFAVATLVGVIAYALLLFVLLSAPTLEVSDTEPHIGKAVIITLFLFWVFGAYIASMQLLEQPINSRKHTVLMLLTLAAIWLATLLYPPVEYFAMIYGCYALAYCWLIAWHYQLHNTPRNWINTTLIIAYLLLGIRTFLMFFLDQVSLAFSPYLFLIGIILTMTIYIALNLMALNHFQAQIHAAHQAAHDLARHDSLTSLYNRLYLEEQINSALQHSRQHPKHFTLIFLDLNKFKHVNDHYGHKAGDYVLQVIAKRLLRVIGKRGTTFRLGGDEFMVLVQDKIDHELSMLYLIKQIKSRLCQPIHFGPNQLVVGASVGYSRYPEDGTTLELLMGKADEKMYQDKHKNHPRPVQSFQSI